LHRASPILANPRQADFTSRLENLFYVIVAVAIHSLNRDRCALVSTGWAPAFAGISPACQI